MCKCFSFQNPSLHFVGGKKQRVKSDHEIKKKLHIKSPASVHHLLVIDKGKLSNHEP